VYGRIGIAGHQDSHGYSGYRLLWFGLLLLARSYDAYFMVFFIGVAGVVSVNIGRFE
jgi:hypothetical protein